MPYSESSAVKEIIALGAAALIAAVTSVGCATLGQEDSGTDPDSSVWETLTRLWEISEAVNTGVEGLAAHLHYATTPDASSAASGALVRSTHRT